MARTPFGRSRAPIGTLGWVLRGAAAGAAGTTALNAVTYLDMTVRGRGTSSTPEQTVEALETLIPWLAEQGYRFGFPVP